MRIIPSIILESLSSFVSSRLITNITLVAFESLLHIKIQCNGSIGYITLKLDIRKANDRVQFFFFFWGGGGVVLQAMMTKMGVQEEWISLITEYILLWLTETIKSYQSLKRITPRRPNVFVIVLIVGKGPTCFARPSSKGRGN